MFDIDALLAAGFEKVLTDQEWQATAHVVPLVDYRLVRGNVLISTEVNTQEKSEGGLQTTVRYPEIAIVQDLNYPNRRATCDADNLELILLLVEQIESLPTSDEHPNRRRREGTTNG